LGSSLFGRGATLTLASTFVTFTYYFFSSCFLGPPEAITDLAVFDITLALLTYSFLLFSSGFLLPTVEFCNLESFNWFFAWTSILGCSFEVAAYFAFEGCATTFWGDFDVVTSLFVFYFF
jgi:hypothetical protein